MNRQERETALLDITALAQSIDRINNVSRGTSSPVVQKYASKCISELAARLSTIAQSIFIHTKDDTNG